MAAADVWVRDRQGAGLRIAQETATWIAVIHTVAGSTGLRSSSARLQARGGQSDPITARSPACRSPAVRGAPRPLVRRAIAVGVPGHDRNVGIVEQPVP